MRHVYIDLLTYILIDHNLYNYILLIVMWLLGKVLLCHQAV